jgi:molybdopterin-guanine dinucleotide biosynthesis protein A
MTGRIGAVVLAGGRSSRFGRDKLAEPIDGRPLLHHAIAAVQAVADEIVVVAAPGQEPAVPAGVRVVHDAAAFEGPLAGLATGLSALVDDIERAVVVAGDMPTLRPAVLSRLLATLGPTIDLALLEVSGESVPLPMAVQRTAALTEIARSLDTGGRRLRALATELRTSVVAEATWRLDDTTGATLRDIDTPSDLPSGTDRRRRASD